MGKAWAASLLLAAVACQPMLPPPPNLAAPQPAISAQGTVLSVERPRPEDSQAFVHVTISPAGEQPVRLVLGPGWYLDQQGLHFEPNESLSAEGRAVVENGQQQIVVRRLTLGDRSYVLRDEAERPVWLKP